eukprot:3819473-Prorocentrum_lima.AAC.1
MAVSDPATLLLQLHGDLLRQIADTTDTHWEGLQSAARRLRFPPKLARRLRNLEATCGFLRHVTSPLCRQVTQE